MTLEVCAHAKINWSLPICGERLDGHHGLERPTGASALLLETGGANA